MGKSSRKSKDVLERVDKKFSKALDSLAKKDCEHDCEEVYSDWDCERYKCKKCGYSYTLWYDDMK